MTAPGDVRAPRREAGLTLVEVLLAAVVFGVVLMASSWALNHAAGTRVAQAREPVGAALLAGHIHTLASTLSREPSGLPPAVDAAGLLALDSLDGAVFSPPLDADLDTLDDLQGWAQQVDIGLVHPATPEVVEAWSPPAALGSHLILLTVDISHAGTSQGRFRWWLAP